VSSDRFAGRVDLRPTSHHVPQGNADQSAGESLAPKKAASTRVTDASVRRLASKLTDTDRAVIETLSIVRVASGAQLRTLHWPDTDTGRRLARHHLAKLTELRIVARLDRRVGGVRAGSDGYTYVLDVAGLRLVADNTTSNRKRRPSTPGDRFLAHALAITDAFVTVRELEARTNAELLAFQAEPSSWRSVDGTPGPQTIKPDAFLLLADDAWEHRWFLEIDRATEHRPVILRKANDYIAYWRSGTEQRLHDIFPKVLWIAPDDKRADDLADWLSTVDADARQLFDTCTDRHLAASLLRTMEAA
jgi:hypothetical protein